jgi:hypothetical protein
MCSRFAHRQQEKNANFGETLSGEVAILAKEIGDLTARIAALAARIGIAFRFAREVSVRGRKRENKRRNARGKRGPGPGSK